MTSGAKRSIAGLAFAIAFLPAPGTTAPTPAPTAAPDRAAQDMLRACIDAPKTISYIGEVQTTRWGRSGATAMLARIEHEAPNRTRRLYVAPESAYGDYVVTIGSTSYEFDTKRNRIVKTQNPVLSSQVALNDNFALLVANYRAVLGPNEVIAGRQAATVSLVNKYTGVRAMRLWIDRQTKLILAKETYRSNGAITNRTRFDEIRYTNEIPPDLFATSPPTGYTVVFGYRFSTFSTDIDKTTHNAGFDALGPRYLPDGFSILSADVTDISGVRTLHLIYSDGLRMVSLFENASGAAADFGAAKPLQTRFENHDAQYVKQGPTTLLAWKERGLSFALVGDLDLQELVAIAASVVP
jgi:outer membrane lipoprotein-sorting protein